MFAINARKVVLAGAAALSVFAASTPALCFAQSVELDTDAAHIIVVRPLDFWSADTSMLKDTMDALRDRRVSYDVVLNGVRYRGSPLVLQGVSDNPVTLGVEAALTAQDTKLVRRSPYQFHVLESVSISPEDYPNFAKAQLDYRQLLWQRQGDPRTLPGREKAKDIVGDVLSLGALFLPARALGLATGAQVMANSGLAEEIGNIPRDARATLVPAVLPSLDTRVYRSIEIRRVEFKPDTPGEIIIAFRTERTPEAEQAALIKAIVALAGAGTTPDAVEQAREADFQARIRSWETAIAGRSAGADNGGT